MLESRIEAWLKVQAERHGDLYLKFTSPGTIGVPDRIIIRHGSVCFVELKQEHGVLSEIQKVQIRKIQGHGIPVYVVYGTEGAHRLVEMLYGEKYVSKKNEPSTTGGLGIEEWR